jgi:HAD superfamily hydrolase (TIGR01549 family)
MERLIAEYREIYWAREHNGTKLFPGVAEAVRQLGGLKSTATTKGTPTTRVVLEKFGLLPYFDHVQGTDGFPAKPSPEVIQRSLRALGVDPREALMIGDAPADIAAARAAGVTVCAVSYGYGNPREMEPDFWINDLCELLD